MEDNLPPSFLSITCSPCTHTWYSIPCSKSLHLSVALYHTLQIRTKLFNYFIMATTSVRRGNYARVPQKTLPITMPTKAPASSQPLSRIAMSPPELSDTSTIYSRSTGGTFSDRSSYAESHSSRGYSARGYPSGIDVMDELSDRMNSAFDPIRMDRSMARQAQT